MRCLGVFGVALLWCMCVYVCVRVIFFVWLAGLVVVLFFLLGEVGCVLLRAVFGLMWCCVIVGCVFFFSDGGWLCFDARVLQLWYVRVMLT